MIKIDADPQGKEDILDWFTCPNCRVCVPRGQACSCKMRTLGPAVENMTRKILTEETK